VAFAWGVAILSLDRLFVVSLTRGGSALGQLFRAFPRLLLALLMGFVISTPLVLQIFRPDIRHQITVMHDQAAAAYYEQASTNPLAKQVAADQAEVNKDLAALGQAQSGEQAAALRQEVSAAEQELQADQAAQEQQTRAFTTANQDNTGLLIRLQALDAITADNAALAAAWWLLVALLVVIECTPILIKMLLNLGPVSIYERMLADEEETQLQVAKHNRALRRDLQIRAAEAMAAGERMVLAGWQADIPDVAQDIIATRRRVEAERLRKWEEDQMLRLAEGTLRPPVGTLPSVSVLGGRLGSALLEAEAKTTSHLVPHRLIRRWPPKRLATVRRPVGCKYSIVTLQRARIRGSARRAGPGDECAELPQAVEDPQRSSTAVEGRGCDAAGRGCSARCTRR